MKNSVGLRLLAATRRVIKRENLHQFNQQLGLKPSGRQSVRLQIYLLDDTSFFNVVNILYLQKILKKSAYSQFVKVPKSLPMKSNLPPTPYPPHTSYFFSCSEHLPQLQMFCGAKGSTVLTA